MTDVFCELEERGFIYQTTDDGELRRILKEEQVSFYIGYDPSASSLHAGNLLTIMAAVHLQKAGHRPLIVVGGGTGMIGDPSGKTEMRKMLTPEEIDSNADSIQNQLSRYIDFSGDKAVLLNNREWLSDVKYIEFLRDIGVHFSVNRMLASESVRQRMEKGLSFLEFNYALLQAYDFYVLARDYNCLLQMGGQDQWGNIVAGIDLIRRKLSKPAYGLTFPLLTDSKGEKFGKSVSGAVWLDRERCSPYDFYQFWRNTDDADVEACLKMFTFLPVDEAKRLGALSSPLINRAKEILAYEAVNVTHGKEEAQKAFASSVRQFGPADPEQTVETSSDAVYITDTDSDIPTVELSKDLLSEGYWVVKLFNDAGLVSSNGEARRLIRQGGLYINEDRVEDEKGTVEGSHVTDGAVILRVGKKHYRKAVFK